MVSKTCSKCGGWIARPGEVIDCEGWKTPPTLCRCGDALAFAGAMALDPSEVEFCPVPPKDKANHWWPFETWRQYGHMDMRRGSWRRARPKRSRIDDLEAAYPYTPSAVAFSDFGAICIRAVCEFVRSLKLGYRDHDDEVAGRIEREFLEPR